MNRISSSRAFWTVVAAFAVVASHADEPATLPPGDVTDDASAGTRLSSESAHALLLGVDANGDGIRDDLSALESSQTVPSTDATRPSIVQRELHRALARNQTSSSAAPRSRCLDYLLLDPKDRAAADRYVQNRTQGAFGTHPCDPLVSPRLERPFETDVAQLQLGPVRLEYSRYE